MALSGELQLCAHVERINITEFDGDGSDDLDNGKVSRLNAQLFVHVFKLSGVRGCS